MEGFRILASAPEPFDPMEKAFHELGKRVFVGSATMPRALVRTYGLRPDLLAITQVWQEGEEVVVAAKGAPEPIAGLCGATEDKLLRVKAAVDAMAADGLRVLGVAHIKACGQRPAGRPTGV